MPQMNIRISDLCRRQIEKLAAEDKTTYKSIVERAVAGCLDALLPERYDKAVTAKLRHQIMSFLVGKESSSDLTKREASALIDWATVEDGWDADPQAQRDAMAILNRPGEDAGQERLEI